MWKLQQTNAGWQVIDQAGVVIATEPSYDVALAVLATAVRTSLAAAPPPAAVPPDPVAGATGARWVSGDSGIVLQVATGDGRDFSGCTYSWRPLDEYPLPLMLQTETEMGHMGAVLAGFIDTMALRPDGGVDSAGFFHTTDAGVNAQTVLEQQGRFGVSVDPGQVDMEDVCTAYDAEGWCVDGYTKFNSYEVIGLTMTPFPAFGQAWIQLAPADAAAPAAPAPVAAAGALVAPRAAFPAFGQAWIQFAPADAAAPAAPAPVAAAGALVAPRAALFMPEPDDDDPRYVDQGRDRVAIPLTITEPDANGWRSVYGHAAVAGTCHIGFRGRCVEPPLASDYDRTFHLGAIPTDDGTNVPTGTLVLDLDHAPLDLAARGAQDHYAHTGAAWADVRASSGRHGVWVCGVVRPGVSDAVLYVAQASTLSGDWREIDGELQMVGCQSVNVPGFPVARHAVAAAGGRQLANAELRAHWNGDRLVELVAAGVVIPRRDTLDALAASGRVECLPCSAAAQLTISDVYEAVAELGLTLKALDRRTRHLIPAERDHLRTQLIRKG